MAYISFQPQDYFNTKLYTGTGAENAVTGVGFQPDFTWLKNRATTNHHTLFDAVRGANKVLYSNLDAIQYTVTQELKSFDSDGFTVGTEASANGSGNGIVSWNWKANGQGSANTDGTINTTYTSVNTTSGFSICQYTGNAVIGATVGHGLGVAPKMIIVKETSGTGDWIVYHASIGNTKRLRLNTTAAEETNAFWNDTTPTSSVWSMNDNGDGNGSGSTYIAYCFAEKTGFSKFGSYTGNGNADGPFIYTGFKPAFVIIKRINTSENWFMFDNKRSPFNLISKYLVADGTGTDSNADFCDFVSNGYKIKVSNASFNESASTYIYMAFAEEPLVSSNGVPAVAR